MVKYLNTVVSTTAPKLKSVLWLKPVSNGFVLYWKNGNAWKPLQIVDAGGTKSIKDDIAYDAGKIIGTFKEVEKED